MKKLGYVAAMACLLGTPVRAQQLVYTPVNPGFGGSPLNYNYLQGTADAQNQFKNKTQTAAQMDYNKQFIQMLESRLYSAMAQKVTDTITNCTSSCNGEIALGDQKVAYSNDGTNVTLIITDGTGKVTTVTVPSFAN